MLKKQAIELLKKHNYSIEDGNITFRTVTHQRVSYLMPTSKFLNNNWWIILDDAINGTLHLFFIPSNSKPEINMILYDDYNPNKTGIDILYMDKGIFSSTKYLITSITYLDKHKPTLDKHKLLLVLEQLKNACEANSVYYMKYLLTNYIDIDFSDQNGRTLLIFASIYNSIGIIKLLIKHRVNLDTIDNYGRTALMHAIENNSIKAAKLLIKQGANIHISDHYKKTTLMIASENNQADIVKGLIMGGINIEEKDTYGCTALMYAAKKNAVLSVIVLIENGADIETNDNSGKTALIYAAKSKAILSMIVLIEKGVDIERSDSSGKTALMYAAQNNSLDATELLIRLGANINAQDKDGMTALRYAKEYIHSKIISKIEYNQNPSILFLKNDIEDIKQKAIFDYCTIELQKKGGLTSAEYKKTQIILSRKSRYANYYEMTMEQITEIIKKEYGQAFDYRNIAFDYDIVYKYLPFDTYKKLKEDIKFCYYDLANIIIKKWQYNTGIELY